MKNISTFLVLVSLLASIRGDSSNGTVENETATIPWVQNNLNQTQGMITTITEENGNELSTPSNEKSNEETENTEKNMNLSPEMVQRKSRDTQNRTSNLGMECISCYGSGISRQDENCYRGVAAKTQKCADIERCFTEIHPQYIKRGCMLPSSINRTFVCKCPLCNDKPSEDLTYYEYRSISDWEYDNKRLEEPVVGLDLLCKVCDTKGVNVVADKSCKLGKHVDYMQCGYNQLCFTNIDHQTDSISRGCVDKPVYNSLYFFCNGSMCNNDNYPNPMKLKSEFMFRTVPLVKASSSARIITLDKIGFAVFLFTKAFENFL